MRTLLCLVQFLPAPSLFILLQAFLWSKYLQDGSAVSYRLGLCSYSSLDFCLWLLLNL